MINWGFSSNSSIGAVCMVINRCSRVWFGSIFVRCVGSLPRCVIKNMYSE